MTESNFCSNCVTPFGAQTAQERDAIVATVTYITTGYLPDRDRPGETKVDLTWRARASLNRCVIEPADVKTACLRVGMALGGKFGLAAFQKILVNRINGRCRAAVVCDAYCNEMNSSESQRLLDSLLQRSILRLASFATAPPFRRPLRTIRARARRSARTRTIRRRRRRRRR